MNIKRRLMVLFMAVAMLVALLPCVFVSATDDAVTARGYMVGNSLTMSMSPRRFAALLATQDYHVTLGGQLNGDTSLPEQVGMLPVNGDSFDFISWKWHKLNTDEVVQKGQSLPGTKSDTTHGLSSGISGRYFEAMEESHFDFVSLQAYGAYPNTPKKWEDFHYNHTVTVEGVEYYEYQYMGDRQAIGLMVDYATQQKNKYGTGADTFLIFESWTYLNHIPADSKSFYEFYNTAFIGPNEDAISTAGTKANTVVPNADASEMLMSGLRSDFSYLPEDTIRLVPVSAVLAELDQMIINGELPGFEEYMIRNNDYYKYARETAPTNVPKSLLDNVYVQEMGIYNLFVDSVHMSSFAINYPTGYYNGLHSGERDGTLASYITAITMYSVLTGYSPVGLPVDMNTTDRKSQFVKADKNHDARLDAVADAELIRAVQEVVFKVLCENEYTGVTEDAPQRTSSSVGHVAGNGSFIRTSTELLAEAPALVASEIALAVSENPVWTPSNAPVAAPVFTSAPEEKKSKEF